MKTKTFFLLTLIFSLFIAACNKITPAGFWKNYKNDILLKDISDQGPYGGHRAIYWRSDNTNTFNSLNFLDFAKKNGWTLVDSSEFNSDQTITWSYHNKAVFPLTSAGFSDTVVNNSQVEKFPRWFSGQMKVYKFKTGWIIIQPGTGEFIEENGFVTINSDRTEMAVYHLWGE